jgi:solute carrier family 25 oxoglutarate transporter 11
MDGLPLKLGLSATSGMTAAVFCHPLDVVRVTMQVTSVKRSTGGTLMAIYNTQGIYRGIYSGLTAAFLRQWTYGACRLGIYSFLLKSQPKPNEVSFPMKLTFGLISGGIGAAVGTPAELGLVRMSADSMTPVEERRGVGIRQVLGNVIAEKGVAGMWNGVGPTVLRAMALNSATLAVTSQCKEQLPQIVPQLKEQPAVTMVLSTFVASFFGTAASQPFDVVKSLMQNMKVPEGGEPPYSGALDCAQKCLRQGPMTLFKGFTPAFVKLTPFTVLSLNFLEGLTYLITGKGAV